MINFPSISVRSTLVALAVPAVLIGAGLAAPLAAQSPVKQVAQAVNAPKDAKFVGKGVVWRCTGTTCIAPESPSRPAISCAAFVKQAGKVTSFTVNGVALDEKALERCNSYARG